MNHLFSYTKKTLKTVVIVVASVFLFVGSVAFLGTAPASAKSLTPEADSYKIDKTESSAQGYYRLRDTQSSYPERKTQQSDYRLRNQQTENGKLNRLPDSDKEQSTYRSLNQQYRGDKQERVVDQEVGGRNQARSKSQVGDRNRVVDQDPERYHGNVNEPTDSVREKLNLDEPLYPGTKEFINDVKETLGGAADSTKDAVRDTKNRVNNVVDNTKDAFGGVGDDVKGTIKGSDHRGEYRSYRD